MTLKQVLRNSNDYKAGKLLITPMLDQWLNQVGTLELNDEESQLFQRLLTAKQRDRTKSFSSSALATCPRRQMFTYIGVPQARSLDSVGAFRMLKGTMLHLTFQFVGLKAGALTRIEVPIRVPEFGLKGSLDGDHDSDYGFELKTTQAFGYYMQKGPSISHIKQIHGYFIGRPDLSKFSLVYWDTRSSEWKEFVIERDRNLIVVMKAELAKLNEQAAYNLLPPILEECKNGKGKTFNDCPYRTSCLSITDWDEAEALRAKVQSHVKHNNHGNAKRTGSVHKRVVRKKRTP